MPLITYHCATCQATDTRVASIDEKFATCHKCGERMDADGELWDKYFTRQAEAWEMAAGGEIRANVRSAGLRNANPLHDSFYK